MGDRTAYTLSMDMSDLSEEQSRAIVDRVFDGYADAVDANGVQAYEKSVGGIYDGAMTEALEGLLGEWGLDRLFVMWEDPAYEWLGTVVIHEPGKPNVVGDCDANGTVLVTADSVMRVLTDTGVNGEAELRAALLRLIGKA